MQELFTTEEAMGYLKISRATLYRLMQSGQLTAHTLGEGGSLRFKFGDLQACLQPRSGPTHLPTRSAPGRMPGVPMKFG